jgi:hypothetical protein
MTRVQNKPAAAGFAVPVATIVVWVAGQCGLDVPPEVAASFASLLSLGAYVLTPAGRN